MTTEINEKVVIDFYINEIDRNDIEFLKNKEIQRSQIRVYLTDIKGTSDSHERVQLSKKIWKTLFEAAMTYIDNNKIGYDKLFEYIDKNVEFEELMFASNSFYRDHTSHSLWVYLLSNYIYKKSNYAFLFDKFHLFYNNIQSFQNAISYFGEKFESHINYFKEITKSRQNIDSIICLISLSHDLGYPIKTIKEINQSIKKILPFYTINHYNEFNFTFENVQKSFVDNFIHFLSTHYIVFFEERLSKDDKLFFDNFLSRLINTDGKYECLINDFNKKDLLVADIDRFRNLLDPFIDIKQDLSLSLRYYEDFEEYKHGIMSAFLLIKTLQCFKDVTFKFSNFVIRDFDFFNFSDYDAKLSILRAITNHTSVGYRISDFSTFSDLLAFVDEIEEFSRISRANLSRKYINEFCKTHLSVESRTIVVKFIFDKEDLPIIDPEKFFINKCKRFLTLFDVANLGDNFGIKIICSDQRKPSYKDYIIEIKKCFTKITVNTDKGIEEKDIRAYLKSDEYYSMNESC